MIKTLLYCSVFSKNHTKHDLMDIFYQRDNVGYTNLII